MANYITTDTELTSVADAIRTKGGTSDPMTFPDGFVSAVDAIPTGGGSVSVPQKEVNFRDYDGTVVYSYTPAEFAALSTMPANPDHSGDEIPLTAQGWNWSFADAQAYVAKYGRLEVGQMYITTDGKTHIKIYIDPNTPANRMTFTLRWTQSVSNGVTVDWGDGSATQTYSGTSAANHDHTYAAGGWYDITLTVTSGTVSFEGSSGTSGNSISGSNANANYYNRNRIREIYFGSGLATNAVGDCCFYTNRLVSVVTIPNGVTSLGAYAFYGCQVLLGIAIPSGTINLGNYCLFSLYRIRYIAIPNSVTSAGNNAFGSIYGIKAIVLPDSLTGISANMFSTHPATESIIIPDSVTSISDQGFYQCYSLSVVNVPNGVTSIGYRAFAYDYALISLTISSSVTSIGEEAFRGCYSCSEYHLQPTTPPTLANSSAFSDNPTDFKIYVPRGKLNVYKTATNWSTYASHMQEEPQ